MNITDRAIALARIKQRVSPGLLTAPADPALDIATRLNYTTVDLDGLLSIKVVFTVITVLLVVATCRITSRVGNTIALLYRTCTSVYDTLSLEVTVCRLCICPEVLHAEF